MDILERIGLFISENAWVMIIVWFIAGLIYRKSVLSFLRPITYTGTLIKFNICKGHQATIDANVRDTIKLSAFSKKPFTLLTEKDDIPAKRLMTDTYILETKISTSDEFMVDGEVVSIELLSKNSISVEYYSTLSDKIFQVGFSTVLFLIATFYCFSFVYP